MRDAVQPALERRLLRLLLRSLLVLAALATFFFAYIGFGGPGSPFNTCIHSADCADTADVRRMAITMAGAGFVVTLILYGVGRYA